MSKWFKRIFLMIKASSHHVYVLQYASVVLGWQMVYSPIQINKCCLKQLTFLINPCMHINMIKWLQCSVILGTFKVLSSHQPARFFFQNFCIYLHQCPRTTCPWSLVHTTVSFLWMSIKKMKNENYFSYKRLSTSLTYTKYCLVFWKSSENSL